MAQQIVEEPSLSSADLGKEILTILKIRQGKVKISLLRCGTVLVEREALE
jgi:hypothetical protein